MRIVPFPRTEKQWSNAKYKGADALRSGTAASRVKSATTASIPIVKVSSWHVPGADVRSVASSPHREPALLSGPSLLDALIDDAAVSAVAPPAPPLLPDGFPPFLLLPLLCEAIAGGDAAVFSPPTAAAQGTNEACDNLGEMTVRAGHSVGGSVSEINV